VTATRSPLRVAAAQVPATAGDLSGNASVAARSIAAAATAGARLVVFPELSLSGYDVALLRADPARCAAEAGGSALTMVGDACRTHRVTAVVGGCVRRDDGWAIGALVVGPDGRLVAEYHKRHLDGHEQELFVPGRHDVLLDVDGWRLGLGICYDASFPEHARSLALAGADAYLCPGAFLTGDSDHRRGVYFPARALENTCYLVFANFTGSHGGWDFAGRSAVWAPNGRALADAGTEEGLAVADLDEATLRRHRSALRMLADRAAPAPPPVPVPVPAG